MTNFMKHFRSTVVAAVATCIGVALVPSLWADNWDKKTTLTITEPLQVPSCCTPDQTVTLQPGEYVIVLVDSLADRHVVRIFDKDQKNVITTILAIPNYRLQPTGKTVFQYWEVPAGQPKAIRAWFYPGDNFGQEFAYSKQTAAQIAAFVKAPVPAIAAETSAADDLKTVPLVAVDEGGKTTELVATLPDESRKTTELTATLPERSPDPVLLPTPQTASAQPQSADRAVDVETPASVQPATESLPHTASAMPLIGLAGLVSLSLFAALGFRSRRTAKV
jgi:LPXTG-motif cell wall-anchored protein